ncbi:uncharacterized protein METZ01_LOCUS230028 [marine metagenome]|uniref:Uncharacterized protein n=1 Tax=marine metagenome TaxID=408172 RepID=A0A382GQS9_9ZZZZ
MLQIKWNTGTEEIGRSGVLFIEILMRHSMTFLYEKSFDRHQTDTKQTPKTGK